MPNIPNTKARSPLSIKVFYIKTGALTAINLQTAKALNGLSWKKIDGVEKFHESEDRNTDARYETDADKSGNVVGRIPKTIEKKITIDRTVMYRDDVEDFFDLVTATHDSTKEIANQTSPFAIVKQEKAPPGSDISLKTTMYLGCMIHNIPKSYELGRDMKVVQSINLGYAEKFII